MDEEKLVIKNVKAEYITTKTDKYENEICYFKLRDKNIDSRFVALIQPSVNLPWSKSEKGQYILKVKTRYCKTKELKKEDPVIVDITFKYYKRNDTQGYYVSLIT